MESTRSFWIKSWQSENRGTCITVVALALVIGTILFAYTAFGENVADHSIHQVAIIFRHGARNPTETYKSDPWKDYKWEDGWGALTTEGMEQEYRLGEWIRKRYDTLIPSKYESTSVLVQSSYAERCIMSAQALLAALFKPQPWEYFTKDLPWRPVPVHPIPRRQDKLIAVKHPCPKLEAALREAYANESQLAGESMTSYYRNLTFYTGQNITNITDVEFLYNTLEIEKQHGLKLPDWTAEFYNEKMRKIAAQSLGIFTSNQIQRRLRGGPLLKQITDNMLRTKNDESKMKLYLYSAHDITLVNVLRAMGFTEELFKPDYGAALIFELALLKDSPEHEPHYGVKVKYLNNTATDEAVVLRVPGCQHNCRLLDLLSAWQDVLPLDWESECRS